MANFIARGVKKVRSWSRKQYARPAIQTFVADLNRNKLKPGLFKNFDWLLFGDLILICLIGIVAIFAATVNVTDHEVHGLIEILATNEANAPRLQLVWLAAGAAAFFAMTFLDYHLFGKYSQLIYIINIASLILVLVVSTAGRGNMTAFFGWTSSRSGQRGFQPSEFGKVAMIICISQLFANRKTEIRNMRELIPSFFYIVIPMGLVVLQPDVGTALVYMVMYAIMLFISGTRGKLICGVLAVALLIAIPLWFWLNTSSDNFRLTRILMWLHPDQYPDDARQVINGQIALGSGGLTGKGLISVGSFASLGYIPDDHTDFCFAIFGEAFGFIGCVILLIAYMVLLGRLLYHSYHVTDQFGSYILLCVFSMFLFHILENIGMILGLLPVTGIPLPFISYGGSSCVSNMMALGLAMNVIMRSRQKQAGGHKQYVQSL